MSDDSDESSEAMRQSRADRRASNVAAVISLIHFLTTVFVLCWFYFGVPPMKHDLESVGVELAQIVQQFITWSDHVVNYLYLMVFVGPPILIVDFVLMRRTAKQIAPKLAVIFGIVIVLNLLAIVALGCVVLSLEHSRLFPVRPIAP